MKSIPIICILTISLLFSCSHEVEPLPDRIEIETQEDIDIICEALSKTIIYDGSIIVNTEDRLDYGCFLKLMEVSGDLILRGPGVVNAFQNITKVLGDDGLLICDFEEENYFFPNLIEVSSFSFPFDCYAVKHIDLPNIESIGKFSVSLASVEPERLSSISGFNKITEINTLLVSGDYKKPMVYDCFENLKTVHGDLSLVFPPASAEVTAESFSKLEKVGGRFQAYVNNQDIVFHESFPKLKICNTLSIFGNNVPLESMCYYKEHIESGDIKNIIYDHNGFLSTAGVLALCE